MDVTANAGILAGFRSRRRATRRRTHAYFEDFAARLDARAWTPDTAPWARWAWDVVERELGPADGVTVVDLGTGTGACIQAMLRFTRNARFIGVDFSEEMIRHASAKTYDGAAEVRFVVSRLDRLDLPPGSVDIVLSAGTFHHIRNKERVAAIILAMLRPGGRFVNIDHFRPGPRYRAETEALRRRHPEETAANDAARRAVQWIYDQDQGHPIEYHTDPYAFAAIMTDAGFTGATVHASLQPGYGVVTARKPFLPGPAAG
ncbi:ubiquinone/menaquinone biosynthesis C-methylase UbiE [Azospirillum fermentarium]|uniref:class I SAM-dependent methyltransferase n=1 Tax=Azospirillum fermentarium TaxID=1233114 RepID=UPI0022276C09|nr:class I SAM-dependent methyltransferase [Azospirillum fermentarium]MCW2247716.1 ubiquinone/menaquinone biosynthesis C-methylase UbiE [Azospirillum fermentarium]